MKGLTERFLEEVGEDLAFFNTGAGNTFNPIIFLVSTLALTVLASFNSKTLVSLLIILFSFTFIIVFNPSSFKLWLKVLLFTFTWTLLVSLPLIASYWVNQFQWFSAGEHLSSTAIKSFLMKPTTASAVFTSMLLAGGGGSFIMGLSAVKAPKEIVRALSSTLVFIPILTKDACRMLAAREARIIKKSVSLSWKILSTVAGDLILRSFERAERIDRAVSARTFGDNIEVQVLNVGELDAILLLSTTLILTIYFIF